MEGNWDKAIEFVLQWEGGYENDPDDPGGETKYGISKRAFPNEDIANLTLDRAKELYHLEYWTRIGGNYLPDKMDIVVFDTAVNCGVGKAVQFLQVAKSPADYLFERLAHYSRIVGKNSKLSKFIRGWMNRVVALWKTIS